MSGDSNSASKAPRQGAFIFVFITVVLDMVALGVTVPVLPKLIEDFKGGDIPAASSINIVFAATWAAMQFVFAPLLGAASDRFGRRPVILLSNLGLGLDYVFMALAPSLSWLFVGRLISGITSSSYPTACAYIADVTPVDQRAAKMGMLGAAFGIGFVVGPAVGGFLGGIDLRLPFWVAAGLSLANATYGFFVLPESLTKEKRGRVDWSKANPLGSLQLLRSHPELFALAVATFLMALAHEALPNVFVFYAGYRYHWNIETVGPALALVGVCSGIVQGGLVGPMVKRFGERACMIIGLSFGCVGFALLGGATVGTMFMAGIPFIALWGLAGPAMQSSMSRRVSSTEQGQLQGAIGSIRGITGMLGPIIMNGTFALTAGSKALTEAPGTVYFLAAAFLVLTFIIAFNAVSGVKVADPSRI
jgi:DHA1 family tetracycline resistance protein-like MFS transporter